jgi:hypothetical protein
MFRDPRYLAPLGVLLGVIVVAGAAARTGSGRSDASVAPVATATAGAPAATATPDGAAIDARRMGDLVKIRDAMLAYRQQHGKFPTSKSLTPICGASSDAGCALAPAPFADGDEPYFFRSDGAQVFLVARGLTVTDMSQCPLVLPDELTGVPLTCLQFARPMQ